MNLSPDSDASLPPEDLALLRNHSFDELDVGDSASLERTLSTQDLRLFAALSGAAVADGAGAAAGAGTVAGAVDDDTALIAHGMWGGMLLASVLGTRLPGPGTTLVGQTLRFLAPLAAGDRLTVRVEVLAKQAEQRQVTLAVACTNQHGAAVIEGQATVHAPARHIERQRTSLPEIRLEAGGRDGLQRLLAQVAGLPPIRVAVVHPCDEPSLSAALDARREGLIDPVLVAPRARLEAVAAEHGLDLGGLRIEDVPHSHAAATRGAELAA
jgi:acyl dehydratase